MISSNDKDSNRAGLARQVSALALTTCSLADLAAADRRALFAIGNDANERYGARKVFLAAVHAALGGEASTLARSDPGLLVRNGPDRQVRSSG